MASLAAAASVKMADTSLAGHKNAKTRVVADPLVTASELGDVILGYLNYKKTKDLWALLAPPPGGPVSYSWHTPPHAGWLAKTSGLLYDLLRLAPNTKLLSQRVCRSLWNLYEKKDLLLENKALYKAEDLVDKMDTAIRLLLSHLRAMKQKDSLREKVYRSLSHDDQVPRGCTYVCLMLFFLALLFLYKSSQNTCVVYTYIYIYTPLRRSNSQEA